jgi:hypothetical protein
MKICDVCQQVTPRLELGPEDLGPRLEACEDCLRDLRERLTALERRIGEIRQQQRIETLADWRRERTPQKPVGV